MKNTDDLLLRADLETLYGVLSRLAEYAKVKEEKELIQLLLHLEKFVEIHKTRTRDMVTYRETIEKARDEYRSLHLKYKGTKEQLDATQKVLHKIMNEKLEEDDKDLGF